MNQELFQLCYLQLESIIDETEKAINSATHSAGSCLQKIEGLEESDAVDEIALVNMRKDMSNIMTKLQFHDEFSQRITHLLDILKLVEDVINAEKVNLTEKREIIEKISSIFSIKSEFEQLQKIFPHLGKVDQSESIELF